MNSKDETNSTPDPKKRTKRSLTADYIASNADPDSDLSHDGTPRPIFRDDDEPVTEPDGKKREEKDVTDASEEAQGTHEKKQKDHHGNERPLFHDEESPKKTKRETSNKNGMAYNKKSKLHRGQDVESSKKVKRETSKKNGMASNKESKLNGIHEKE